MKKQFLFLTSLIFCIALSSLLFSCMSSKTSLGVMKANFYRIGISGRYLWAGTNSTIERYDSRYRGWQTVQTASSEQIETLSPVHHDILSKRQRLDSFVKTVNKYEKGIIIGTSEGFLVYDSGRDNYSVYKKGNGLPGNYIVDSYEDRNLSKFYIWFITSGGVARYDVDTTRLDKYTKANGLPSDYVTLIAVDKQHSRNYVWFATENGITRYNESKGEWVTYTQDKDNLPSNVINEIQLGKNYMWVGTSEGVAEYSYKYDNWRIQLDFKESDGE